MSYDNLFDLLVLLLLLAAFILGYLQGTVRRLLGIASILFSFLFAAQARGPLGDFLIGNWTQFPPEYSRMLAFGLVFVIATVALTIVIENYYERSPILPRFPLLDPILGAILGVIQAGIIIGAGIMILDSYFQNVGSVVHPTEILFLRDLDHAVTVSQTAQIYRDHLIPAFLLVLGALIPEDVRRPYPA